MSQRETQLPDLDTLDVQSLKALVLAKQAELDSRATEIESLKLLIVKLKRMHFGPSSEKYDRELQQLELRLEDLEANQAAAEPPPAVPATVAWKQTARLKPARRPLPAELPRETETIAPDQEACPDCGGTLRGLGEDVTEMLEYVPGRFKVTRTVRPKLSCGGCSRIVQAPAPNRPIDRAAWLGPGCWRMFWYRSMPIICRFTASRRSTGGRASNWTARHWPIGWAARAGHCSRWWMR